MYRLTVVVRSRYKLLLTIGLFLVSCSIEPDSKVTFEGINLNSSGVFVDAVSLDSVSFASGENRWFLRGMIVDNGIEYPYSMIYNQNPIRESVNPVQILVPGCFKTDKETPSVKLTENDSEIVISWRTNSQFLCVKTILTSGH